mmetsp:Transcript_15950/g.47269  ORF Transcript_15950/g.47269 Transcript_15950/m.47269 type:complete len:201 (-) Transcript_15950:849-1451(-)
MNTNMTSIAVISAPRLAGDKKPHSAKTIVATTIEKICTPVPTCVASSDAPGGGRNTSPCTSFHPDSSALISASSWLYLLMSRASARSRMTATIALRNSTMSIELTIENQWMSSSYMWRYRSQRLTQRTSLDTKRTSYENTTSAPSSTACGHISWVTKSTRPGLQVSSMGRLPPPDQSVLCFTLNGSTSNPTMRDVSLAAS